MQYIIYVIYIIYVVYLSGKYTACLSGKFLCRKTSLTGGFCRWLHRDCEVHIIKAWLLTTLFCSFHVPPLL